MDAPRAYGRVEPDKWIATAAEQQRASRTIVATFLACFLGVLVAGLLALAGASTADLDYEGLDGGARASCLRASRRADYTVGLPQPRLARAAPAAAARPGESGAARGGEPAHLLRAHAQVAHDGVRAARPAARLHAGVQGRRDAAGQLERAPEPHAHILPVPERQGRAEQGKTAPRRSGSTACSRPLRARTYWLTTSHLCFAPSVAWGDASDDVLLFDEHMNTAASSVRAFEPPERFAHRARASEGACNASLHDDAPIRVFPPDGGQRGRHLASR